MIDRTFRAALAAAALAGVALAGAADATVINSVPYDGTPDWRTAAFGSLASYDGVNNEVTMTTNSGGVFFGSELGGSGPYWNLGSNADGNDVSITARLGDGARDWSAYLSDGIGYAGIQFRPTDCDGNAGACYYAPYRNVVDIYFADALGSSTLQVQSVDIDMSVNQNYGFLLKDGLVRYVIGANTYSGYSLSGSAYRILVIGDGSGSTQTGSGSMTISAARLDTAPEDRIVLDAVPEPSTWAMMIGGFGLVGAATRRTKRRLAHR